MSTPTDAAPSSAPAQSRRILSIDGGGIKGVVPAAFLATIEESVGRPIGEYFDLIVGTSTGGIIALGLGLGFTAQQILRLYEDHGPEIFGRRRLGLLAPRYDAGPLERALTAYFGDRRLGESRNRLVIPSFNLDTGEVHIYKTAHHARYERDYRCRAVEVALATSAAPWYFPAHRAASGTPLVDGGAWANNPVGLSVVEAIGVLGWAPTDLQVLSLGCTTEPFGIGKGRLDRLGLWRWAFKFVDLFLAGQSSGSLGTAYVLAGHDRVHRISPVVEKGRFSLAGVDEIPSLRGIGASAARNHLPRLRPVFLGLPAEPFVPCHPSDDQRAA